MAGTSLDGVDAAIVDFSVQPPRLLGTHYVPYPDDLRAEAAALNVPGANEIDRAHRLASRLADLYGDAVRALLSASGSSADQVAAIGCHGQTIRHRPDIGYTVQLGNGARLAERTAITVVADFRSRDVAANGQGAPLVPAFHRMWFGATDVDRAVVNIGGIANLTLLPVSGSVSGWDTGPGNTLFDLWTARNRNARYDAEGQWAAGGTVIPELLASMLGDDYFARTPPKSTGRDYFNLEWIDRYCSVPSGVVKWSAVDVQATLVALTATTIARAIDSNRFTEVYVCGGGANNRHLMTTLTAALRGRRVATTSALGLDPDWVEAVAFAWLARCAVRGEPGNLPAVTGADGLRVLGAIYPA
jgi:anhydro-N-acetylmuramic acid kinase